VKADSGKRKADILFVILSVSEESQNIVKRKADSVQRASNSSISYFHLKKVIPPQ